MAKKLAAILLCVVLIFVGVLALGHLTRPLGDDVAIANVENFHKLPENSIDVIVYGSSHAWRNVNVDEMYDKYGIGAYNYAANWQHLDTTWLFVHDSLATQTPKVALIEGMHINSNEFDTDMDGEIYYTTDYGTYGNVVRILVPLTASDALIDEGLTIIAASLDALKASV